MIKKFNRAVHGPGWIEVILGAAVSLIVGVVLGAVLLAFQPVVVVKELPKDPDRDAKATYYVEGSRDLMKARGATAKRKAFAEGQSVTVTEDELNILAGPPVPFGALRAVAKPAGAQPGQKAPVKAPAPAPAKGAAEGDAATFVSSSPNFRVNENALHIGALVTVNALGLGQKILVQARGNFVKHGEVFTYEPNEIFVGACPVHRLPYVFGYVREKFMAQQIPDDFAAAWKKLASVAIDGNALKLTMP